MATKRIIDDKFKDAIDNYGDEIRTLEDFIEAVRTRPGMYIGPIGNAGFLNMIREIFQNSADQKLDKTSPCDTIWVNLDMTSLTVTIMDNGKGLPFNDIMRIITEPHTSKNFVKKPGQYSSGLNGIGAKVVNGLSEYFLVESFRYDGTAVKLEFKDGYPTTKAPVKIPNKDKFQGTRITFVPDIGTMKEINIDWKVPYHLIKQIVSLLPIGTLVKFQAIDYNGKVFTEDIINKDGIITDLIQKCKHPIIKPIVISNDDGYHKLDIAFCYDFGDGITGPDEVENITAFSNMCPTTRGTHIDGSVEGICRWFSLYMNNIYLANQKAKDKLKVTFNDIRNGLNIMISAAHLDPEFTGQAKEILSNADMAPFCKETLMKGLDEWSRSNPADLSKLAKFFKEIAEIRQKGEKEKDKIVKKYVANPLTNLPKKYKRPLDKDGIELIIVEGDSALGSVEKARNPHKQGIFPIRGKFPNAFQKSKHEFWNNEEVQGIRSIIFGGGEYKRNFDVSECKVSRVIFLADKISCPEMLFAKPCGLSL